MILDLDLGLDSGYEFLRLRHHAPALSEIHTIVRSGIAEENRRICELFNVGVYIPKWEGAAALQEALQTLNPLGRSNDPRHRIIEPRLAKPGRFQATLSSAGSTSLSRHDEHSPICVLQVTSSIYKSAYVLILQR